MDVFSPLLGPRGVRSDGLEAYSVDGVEPRLLLRPADERQVAEALAAAAGQGMAMVARGGGTQMALGNPPRRLDAVLELSRLSALVDHQPADLTATAQAGITLARLQEELARHGQMFPLDPPLPERATLGGTVAASTSGPRRLAFGTPRDLVLGMRVAHPDGVVTRAGGRVVKNVTGYDLNKLYVGSLGTLGVIVEATVKVLSLPTVERTIVAEFHSLASAARASLDVLSGGLGLLALVVLNEGAVRHLEGVSPDGGQALVLAEAGGRQAAVERRVKDVARICRQAGAVRVDIVERDDGRRLWRTVGDLGFGEGAGAPLAVARCGALPIQVAGLCAALEDVAQQYPYDLGVVCLAGHGSGIVRSLWWSREAGDADARSIAALVGQVRVSARSFDTDAVVERCPAEAKTHLDVWGPVEEIPLGIMRRLKGKFDPRGVLSPGRFVGGI